jgi:hypothetical protein
MMEYLMLTRDNIIHVTDKDLHKKKITIGHAIDDTRRVLFEVVAKEESEEFFRDFWTPERGYC